MTPTIIYPCHRPFSEESLAELNLTPLEAKLSVWLYERNLTDQRRGKLWTVLTLAELAEALVTDALHAERAATGLMYKGFLARAAVPKAPSQRSYYLRWQHVLAAFDRLYPSTCPDPRMSLDDTQCTWMPKGITLACCQMIGAAALTSLLLALLNRNLRDQSEDRLQTVGSEAELLEELYPSKSLRTFRRHYQALEEKGYLARWAIRTDSITQYRKSEQPHIWLVRFENLFADFESSGKAEESSRREASFRARIQEAEERKEKQKQSKLNREARRPK